MVLFSTPLLTQLHWIPVKLYLLYRDAVLTFKCLNGITPESLSQQFARRVDISGRCTRNSSSLNIPFFRSATGQRTFYYRAVSLWNELPENIKCSSSVNIFKHKLRKYLLGNHSQQHLAFNNFYIHTSNQLVRISRQYIL